jgi:hypothetical protein
MFIDRSLPPLTQDVIDSMARGTKIRRRVVVVDPSLAAERYDGAIGLMTYDPRYHHQPGDVTIATIKVPGAYLETNEQLVGAIIKKLQKEAPGMRRVALIDCPTVKSVTKGHSFGLGGVGSGNPERTIASSGAIGWSGGKSQTVNEEYSVIYAYAMNGGPLNLPPPPPAPPAPKEEATPTVSPQAMLPPPPAPPQPQPQRETQAPTAVALAAPPQRPLQAAVDTCSLPKGAIYFGFNCRNVYGRCHAPSVPDPGWQARSSGNRRTIALFEAYLGAHPACRVTVEGYTDHYGSQSYNASLGLSRANAVYGILRSDPQIAPQIAMSDSNGKNSAYPGGRKFSETNRDDRKVILVVRGPSSNPGN